MAFFLDTVCSAADTNFSSSSAASGARGPSEIFADRVCSRSGGVDAGAANVFVLVLGHKML